MRWEVLDVDGREHVSIRLVCFQYGCERIVRGWWRFWRYRVGWGCGRELGGGNGVAGRAFWVIVESSRLVQTGVLAKVFGVDKAMLSDSASARGPSDGNGEDKG